MKALLVKAALVAGFIPALNSGAFAQQKSATRNQGELDVVIVSGSSNSIKDIKVKNTTKSTIDVHLYYQNNSEIWSDARGKDDLAPGQSYKFTAVNPNGKVRVWYRTSGKNDRFPSRSEAVGEK